MSINSILLLHICMYPCSFRLSNRLKATIFAKYFTWNETDLGCTCPGIPARYIVLASDKWPELGTHGLIRDQRYQPVRYRTKLTQSGIFLVRYRTKIRDAGMPMPALVSSMPMPSYVMTHSTPNYCYMPMRAGYCQAHIPTYSYLETFPGRRKGCLVHGHCHGLYLYLYRHTSCRYIKTYSDIEEGKSTWHLCRIIQRKPVPGRCSQRLQLRGDLCRPRWVIFIWNRWLLRISSFTLAYSFL